MLSIIVGIAKSEIVVLWKCSNNNFQVDATPGIIRVEMYVSVYNKYGVTSATETLPENPIMTSTEL